MGKYMRKAKVSGEVAVMEVSPQSSLGVRTRARTLALQRLQKPSPLPDDSSYLELRSRRLEKPPPVAPKGPQARPSSTPHRTKETNTVSLPDSDKGSPEAEVSSGENVLEAEARDRWVLFYFSLAKSGFFILGFLSLGLLLRMVSHSKIYLWDFGVSVNYFFFVLITMD